MYTYKRVKIKVNIHTKGQVKINKAHKHFL